jgi:23S rRNA pseudouridine2605 synthase
MRLAKYLAHAGVASRRSAETMIGAGRVSVDGQIVTDPARDVGAGTRVLLDGRLLEGPEPRVHYILNKPVGVLSTAKDTHRRPTVVELVPEQGLRLYPVGRLDADSSGLMLLTNDGELANRLTHPSFEVAKRYRVSLGGPPVGRDALDALRGGVELDDGPTAPTRVRHVGKNVIELTIHEGRNRQVRRMCAAVGLTVLELRRIGFGSLRLEGLEPGAYRRLSAAEVERLRAL